MLSIVVYYAVRYGLDCRSNGRRGMESAQIDENAIEGSCLTNLRGPFSGHNLVAIVRQDVGEWALNLNIRYDVTMTWDNPRRFVRDADANPGWCGTTLPSPPFVPPGPHLLPGSH